MEDYDTEFIRFRCEDTHRRRYQDQWVVLMANYDRVLGRVKWHKGWNSYVFWPNGSTMYDAKCLSDLEFFITELNREMKGK